MDGVRRRVRTAQRALQKEDMPRREQMVGQQAELERAVERTHERRAWAGAQPSAYELVEALLVVL